LLIPPLLGSSFRLTVRQGFVVRLGGGSEMNWWEARVGMQDSLVRYPNLLAGFATATLFPVVASHLFPSAKPGLSVL
jgi:hypothetical protein